MNLIPPTTQSLMDVLTNGNGVDTKGIMFLCSQWEVMPVISYPPDGSRAYYNWAATITELARHVQKQSGG